MTDFFKTYLDAWATEDVEAVLAFFHDDVRYEDTTLGHGATGMKQMRRFVTASFTNVPGAHFDYVGHHSTGTEYAIEWVMQPQNVRGVSIGKLLDGKIIENRDYWDGAKYKVPNT